MTRRSRAALRRFAADNPAHSRFKHDGFRIIARKGGPRVQLYSRPGNDLTGRFPLIVETLAGLRARSCIIDGEAVACDDNGVASFNLIRYQRANGSIFLYAFDLIELNGDDLRRDPLEVRKATLASIVAKAQSGIRFNEHIEGDGHLIGRTADGRVHRAMLESGARVPPHCLEAVHSRLRAAQVVPWRHAYSNRLAGDGAHGPPAGSPHFLSSLIERSLS